MSPSNSDLKSIKDLKLNLLKGASRRRALMVTVAALVGFGAGVVHADTSINTAQPYYLQSQVGTTVTPSFQGGTLRDDQNNVTDSNNYTVQNFSTNTIDAFGHITTFSGTFSGVGPLIITDAGTVELTNSSYLTGTVTINTGATLEWGAAAATLGFIEGGTGLVDNGTLLINYNGGGVASASPISGGGALVVQSGGYNNEGVSTYTGTTTVDAGGTLMVSGGGSISNSSSVIVNGIFDISGETAGTSITSLSGSGQVNLSNQALTLTNASGTFSGVLADGGIFTQGTGGSLIISGGTETLTGANTYTGLTTINSGAGLQLGNGGTTGSVAGDIANAGTFLNRVGGTVGGLLTNSGSATNSGTLNGGLLNTLNGAVANFGTINDGATNSAVTSTGAALANFGTINGGVINTAGIFGNFGTVNGGLQNSANVSGQGAINGAIVNSGAGVFTAGTLTGNGSFTNSGTAVLDVAYGNFTGLTSLSNVSTAANGVVVLKTLAISGAVSNAAGATIHVGNGGLLTAGSVSNAAGGSLIVDVGGAVIDNLNNSGTVSNSGTYNADVGNSGTSAVITNQATGAWTGNILSNSNGATLANAGTWTGTVANAATFINVAGGTLSGLLSQTAGTTTNAGTLNGGAVITGGTLTTTGAINGGLSNAATVNASGQVNGAIVNSGMFVIIGALGNDGSAFNNTGTLAVGGFGFTGIGAFSNAAGATVSIGTATTAGTLDVAGLTNAGTLNMQNGRTGDRMVVTGTYTGVAGSILAMDVNLTTGASDRLIAGSTAGTTTISLQNVGGTRGYLPAPIALVTTTGANNGTFVAASDAQTQAALASNGIVDYRLAKLNDGWGLVSTLNGAAVSTITNQTALFLNTLDTSLRPTTHDLLASPTGEGWSGHVWMHATYADNLMSATTTSDDGYSAPVNTLTRLDAEGVMAGAETQHSGGNTSLQLGVAGGWTNARAKDDGGYGTRFNVPSVGAYAVLSVPHLLVGVQAWHDDLSTRPDGLVSAGAINGHDDTFALSLAAPVTRGIYTFEPYADYTTSGIHINPFAVLGGAGTLGFSSLSDDTAGGGLRLSAVTVSNGVRFTPFVSAGVESVSGHGEHSIFTPTGGGDSVTLTTTGPGSYTAVSIGVDAVYPSGIQAYGRIDGRFGSAINGVSLSGGLRLRF